MRRALLPSGVALVVLVILAGPAGSAGSPQATNPTYGNATASQCSPASLQGDSRFGPATLPTTGRVGLEVTGYDPFGGLGPSGLLSTYWNSSTNGWNYPPFNGFATGSDGQPIMSSTTLPPGQTIDRFGSEFGQFLSPGGASYPSRALPPSNLDNPGGTTTCNYHLYQVASGLTLVAGPIAPWFGQPGAGTQYFLQNTNVRTLLGSGALVRCDLARGCPGYLMAGSDGGVFAFGGATFTGSMGGRALTAPIEGLAPTADALGYWLVGADGGVFAFGDAAFEGSVPALGQRVSDIVGLTPTPDGRGYWMVGSDGGVFTFGDANYYGSLPGLQRPVADIVGITPSADGGGYWLVGADGGVFAFGDAPFEGSVAAARPVHELAPTGDGQGYWLVGTDGGVFAFGDAPFEGSLPALGVTNPDVVSLAPVADGRGYWLMGADGGVFAFGDAPFFGSLGGRSLTAPVLGAAAVGATG